MNKYQISQRITVLINDVAHFDAVVREKDCNEFLGLTKASREDVK